MTDEVVDRENRHQDRVASWAVWEQVGRANEPEGETTRRERLPVRVVPRVGPVNLRQLSRQVLGLLSRIGVYMEPETFGAERMGAVYQKIERRYWPELDAIVARHRAERMERIQKRSES